MGRQARRGRARSASNVYHTTDGLAPDCLGAGPASLPAHVACDPDDGTAAPPVPLRASGTILYAMHVGARVRRAVPRRYSTDTLMTNPVAAIAAVVWLTYCFHKKKKKKKKKKYSASIPLL